MDNWKVDFTAGFISELVRSPPSIVVNEAMRVQYRFPRNKKRKVRARWRKNPANFKPDLRVFRVGGDNPYFICHPAAKAALDNQLRKEGYITPSPMPLC